MTVDGSHGLLWYPMNNKSQECNGIHVLYRYLSFNGRGSLTRYVERRMAGKIPGKKVSAKLS